MLNKTLASIAALTATLAVTAPALADDQQWEVIGGIGHYFFDSSRQVDDVSGFNLGVGRRISDAWSLEFIAQDLDTDTDIGGIDVDGRHYRLDSLYHFDTEGAWKPYLAMGVGDMELEAKGTSGDHETLLNVGLGVKRALAEDWRLRADARAYRSLDEEETDFGINVGLSYLFGGSSAPAKAMPAAPQDTDGDGVVDSADVCPNTPAGVAVNAQGCPLDSDRDGVYDYQDQCPETGANLKVDAKGCPQTLTESVSIELEVYFDNNSDVVKPAYFSEIKRVADFMGQYLSTVVTVAGHTDDRGAASYNQNLSQRRAEAVRQVLMAEMGIAAERIKAVGHGEAKPVADNSTAEGRKTNRRVVAEISSQVERAVTK